MTKDDLHKIYLWDAIINLLIDRSGIECSTLGLLNSNSKLFNATIAALSLCSESRVSASASYN